MEHGDWDPAGLGAGCSVLAWSTRDGRHLWGRNYDFDHLAEGAAVTFLPRGTCCGTAGGALESRFACMGVGLMLPTGPVLYEGINERGLMGGQLYYRGFARYGVRRRPGALPLQPPLLVYHLLARCATAAEAADCLEREIDLVPVPLLGAVPPLHWSFSDRTGETIVVEPDGDGVHVYRGTLGVMTNSPGYPWHRLNLLNYAGIRDLDRRGPALGGDLPGPCFSGSGAQGLPGDWSSPSRFVRLAFLRRYCVKGGGEEEGVARMLRLFQSAAFPDGMVRVSDQGHVSALDTHVTPWDYTVYTALMCAESLRFYWTTYQNQRIRCVDLRHLLDRSEPLRFPLEEPPEIRCLSGV